MKIRFKNYHYEFGDCFEVPIINISYEILNGEPIDIMIMGTKKNIEFLTQEYIKAGNSQKADTFGCHGNKELWDAIDSGEEIYECLIARLPEFEVVDYHSVRYF